MANGNEQLAISQNPDAILFLLLLFPGKNHDFCRGVSVAVARNEGQHSCDFPWRKAHKLYPRMLRPISKPQSNKRGLLLNRCFSRSLTHLLIPQSTHPSAGGAG
jgi:hypothetical protein